MSTYAGNEQLPPRVACCKICDFFRSIGLFPTARCISATSVVRPPGRWIGRDTTIPHIPRQDNLPGLCIPEKGILIIKLRFFTIQQF